MAEENNASTENMDAAAQRRMERWLLSPELQEHMEQAKDVKKPTVTGPYISLSRQAGAGGVKIARIVGHQLGWDVLDKELLDFMTKRYNMPRDMLDVVDETRANWFHDVLGAFIDDRVVSQDRYVVHMEKITYIAAMHGNIVFVGRGAQFLLPRNHGLAVRVIAPKSFRIKELMRRMNLTRPEAERKVDSLDAGRRDFCQRHFHHDIEKSMEYDLIINTDRLSPEAAAELIVDAFCHARREGSVM